jgi:hypothetical protein
MRFLASPAPGPSLDRIGTRVFIASMLRSTPNMNLNDAQARHITASLSELQ